MNLTLVDHRAVALGTVAAAATLISAVVWYKRQKSSQPPEKWMKIGEVSNLYLYPIKSCMGLKQAELECTRLGSKSGEMRDRMFVVVDENGAFVTGREYPKMIRIEASLNDGILKLSAVDYPETVEVDLGKLENSPQEVRIWNSLAMGIDCGNEVSDWLVKFIQPGNAALRLLYYGNRNEPKEMNPRLAKAMKLMKRNYELTDSSLFSDAASYHLISESSVQELNSRLPDEKVSHRNFRPNIVIKGFNLIPFEEDSWDWVKIGDVVFRFLSPCGRCVFTTVDPSSTAKSEKYEPVATLRKYRFFRNVDQRQLFQAPKMGIYLGARSEGFISVGDDVMIPQPRTNHLELPGAV